MGVRRVDPRRRRGRRRRGGGRRTSSPTDTSSSCWTTWSSSAAPTSSWPACSARRAALCLIATSRRPLHVVGEQEFAVPAAVVAAQTSALAALDESPAVQLFVRHARRVRPGLLADARVRAGRRGDLSCARRTAAGHRAHRRPVQAAQPAGDPAPPRNRPRPLRRGGRPDRNGTAACAPRSTGRSDSSTTAHQAFFARLGVFADGADLAAVEAVCTAGERGGEDALDLALDIVDASLATVTDATDGEPRIGAARDGPSLCGEPAGGDRPRGPHPRPARSPLPPGGP